MRQFVDNQKYPGVVYTASQVEQKLSLGVWDVSRDVDCDRITGHITAGWLP